MEKISGYILSNSTEFYGELGVEDGKIVSIVEKDKYEVDDCLIMPGFIDLHSHGAMGYDVMDASEESLKEISEFHLRQGTTSYFPTALTAKQDDILNVAEICNKFVKDENNNIEGLHLEGPFINNQKLGAQPKFARDYNVNELKDVCNLCSVKIITAAPEIGDYSEFLDFCKDNSINLQIGHSVAGYDKVCEALDDGFCGCTHLFNAMIGLHHREPGMIGAIFEKGDYAEIICDLKHVHPSVIKTSFKNIPNLYAVSDTCAATGMSDGKFTLGENEVYIEDGAVYLEEDVLAGSCATIYDMFKNLIKIGFSQKEAYLMTSYRPAQYIKNNEIGDIKEGLKANIVVLNDKNYDMNAVYLNGNICRMN